MIVISPGADLVMTAVSGPTTGSRGGSIVVTSTVGNQGSGKSNSCSVGLYLSTDATITTADRQLGTRSVGSLAIGATNTGSKTVTVPTSVTAGTYYLGAIADYANQAYEADETNNSLTGNQITIN